jgi:PAS domain S-box-containing protein
VARCSHWARLAGVAVAAVGAIVCIGWLFDIAALRQLHPVLASMKFNTALALALLGVALRFAISRDAGRERWIARGLAAMAAAIAAASLLEYELGIELGIDELLCRDPSTVGAPGRMSPATGGCIALLGIVILRLESWWAEQVVVVVALVVLVALLGYLYGTPDLYAIGPYASITLYTALGLFALTLGLLLARPQRGWMQLFASESASGVLTRSLAPAAVVVPVALARLRQWGEQAGLYGTGFGRAILVVSVIVIFVGLILHTAAALDGSDYHRRMAEDAVRVSEADLATTLESIGDALISTDEHGCVARMNAAAERLTGWRFVDARRRPLTEVFRIVDEDTREPVDSPVNRVLREGIIVGLANHTLLIARDGTERAIADSGAPIRNPDGVTRGVVVVFQDQSETRVAERRVRESEARKAAILASTLDAIVSVDASGIVAEFNPAAEAMFGYARGDVIGRSIVEVLAPDGGRDGRNSLALYLAGVEPSMIGKRIELTAMRADRSEFPVEASITRVDLDGPPSFTGFIRDVTEARQARASLMRSHARLCALADVSDAFAMMATSYQALLDRIAQVIADVVGDGCSVTLVSDDGQQLLTVANAHRDPALAQEYRAFLTGMTVSAVTSSAISAVVARTGRPQRADTTPSAMVARSEEAIRPIVERLNVHSFAVVPIRARQTVTGTLSLLRSRPGYSYTDDDVTLLQDLANRAGLAIENARLYSQLEQRVNARTAELRAANEELEAFSYSAAHDLRAPLRAISGYSQMLAEDHADRLGVAGAEYLASIRSAAQRMAQIIDDLLELSRIGRTQLRRERVAISELANMVVDRLRNADPQRIVDVTVEDGLVAQADRSLLEIALTNLLSNAWKFTGKCEHAHIELTTHASERPTTYVVRDNGAGFDAAYADKLFGMFQRLHATSDFEGTGLGLATVQRVIQHHGGRVWAEGQVGAGAAFFFTLEAGQP